jgi:hypothetical protein
LIVCDEKLSVPLDAVVQPAAADAVGALQPEGTTMSTSPEPTPAAAAVYVNVTVFPVDDAVADAGEGEVVPNPSAAAAHRELRMVLAAIVNVSAATYGVPVHSVGSAAFAVVHQPAKV